MSAGGSASQLYCQRDASDAVAAVLGRVWNDPGFELWEEVKGLHHFNMLISIRGLLDGAVFAERLGDDSSAKKYRETAAEIQKSLGRFWKEDENYLLSTIEPLNDHGKIRWLDTGACPGPACVLAPTTD